MSRRREKIALTGRNEAGKSLLLKALAGQTDPATGTVTICVNYLILNEPTSHLGIQSREVLLEALQQFTGTLTMGCHDRYFLCSLVNRVFEIDHGQMRIFEGNYANYLEQVTPVVPRNMG
jgi:ATPase subunit of ABC transporter with duplicated ATPase domains